MMMTEGNSAFAMSQLKFNTLSLSSTAVEQSITGAVSWTQTAEKAISHISSEL